MYQEQKQKKTKRLIDLLKEKGIFNGGLIENLGIEFFDNGNILLGIKEGKLFYCEYPYRLFRLFEEELLELKDKLNLSKIKVIKGIYDGDMSHLKDFFALSVIYSKQKYLINLILNLKLWKNNYHLKKLKEQFQ